MRGIGHSYWDNFQENVAPQYVVKYFKRIRCGTWTQSWLSSASYGCSSEGVGVAVGVGVGRIRCQRAFSSALRSGASAFCSTSCLIPWSPFTVSAISFSTAWRVAWSGGPLKTFTPVCSQVAFCSSGKRGRRWVMAAKRKDLSIWTIGITDRPDSRRTEHGKPPHWMQWKADSEAIARAVEKYFLEKGMNLALLLHNQKQEKMYLKLQNILLKQCAKTEILKKERRIFQFKLLKIWLKHSDKYLT